MKRFPRKRVFITGAASGFGRALAIEFGRRGWKVAVSDIDSGGVEKVATEVAQAGGDGIGFRCDVAKSDDLERAAERVREAWDGLDILINNAGIAGGGRMEEIPLESWRKIMDTNLWSVIYGCRSFIPMLRQQGAGQIVNVASSAGILSGPRMASYNVTKAGVISLSETLRVELAEDGIGVTVVAPTFFKTNLLENSERDSASVKTFDVFERSMAETSYTADTIALATLRAVERNRLYVLPQTDARINWYLKRLSPARFSRLFTWMYDRRLYLFQHFDE